MKCITKVLNQNLQDMKVQMNRRSLRQPYAHRNRRSAHCNQPKNFDLNFAAPQVLIFFSLLSTSAWPQAQHWQYQNLHHTNILCLVSALSAATVTVTQWCSIDNGITSFPYCWLYTESLHNHHESFCYPAFSTLLTTDDVKRLINKYSRTCQPLLLSNPKALERSMNQQLYG